MIFISGIVPELENKMKYYKIQTLLFIVSCLKVVIF